MKLQKAQIILNLHNRHKGEMAKSQGIIPFIDVFMHLYLMFNT